MPVIITKSAGQKKRCTRDVLDWLLSRLRPFVYSGFESLAVEVRTRLDGDSSQLYRPMAVVDPLPSDVALESENGGVQSSFSLVSLPMRRRAQPLVAITSKNCLYARLSNDEISSAREHNDVSSLMKK